MDTLKTAVVVLLLLAVMYGVYVVLNKPTESLPLDGWQAEPIPNLEVDLGNPLAGGLGNAPEPQDPPAATAWSMPASMPAEEVPATNPGLLKNIETPEVAVTAPDLLPGPPQEIPQTKAAELAAQQWPTDTPAGTPDVTAPVEPAVPDLATPDLATADLAATESATPSRVTPWQPPAAAAPDSTPPAPVELESLATTPSAESAAEQVSAEAYSPFESALQSAADKVQNEQWHDALWTLSLFYDSPDLRDDQRQQLQDWLDPLAARVIYSREHLIENAYAVQPGDTLESVAENYGVPWQLLANINGFHDPQELAPGTTLKVVRGPMRAEVNLTSSMLTVFVGKLYAGRFPISAGQEPAPAPGEYRVEEKTPGRTYYAGDGQTIPPGDPANPFGNVWIHLGNEFSLHGRPTGGPAEAQGCIGLDQQDANDVYGILSKGSSVTILR